MLARIFFRCSLESDPPHEQRNKKEKIMKKRISNVKVDFTLDTSQA